MWPEQSREAAGAAETPTQQDLLRGATGLALGAGPGELWSRGWSRAARRLSAVHQRRPLPEWGLSPVLPLLSYVNKPCLPPLSSKLLGAGVGSQLGGRDGSRWPAVLTHLPRSQCGAASPALIQGEPLRRGGGLSVPSTPGKQRPPHPPTRCAEAVETGSPSAVPVAPGSWPHGPVAQ